MLEIVGDAGIGKSRMLDEVRSLAGTFAVRSAACELYDRLTPYAALRPLLRSLLDLGADADASQLAHVVNLAAPELVAWLPLIGAPLDIETEPTPEVDRMSESFRRAKLNEVMVQLLERVVARPTLLLIEDVHWMDEASASLLERICRTAATRPWMIAVTRRDADSGFVAPPGPSADTIRLSPLGAGEATALVEAAAGAAPLRPHEQPPLPPDRAATRCSCASWCGPPSWASPSTSCRRPSRASSPPRSIPSTRPIERCCATPRCWA